MAAASAPEASAWARKSPRGSGAEAEKREKGKKRAQDGRKFQSDAASPL